MTAPQVTEARVPLVEREEIPPRAEGLTRLYDRLEAERGIVPNLFKALSNVPGLALGIAAFLDPLMDEGTLPAAYKKLIVTHVAALNRCEYCVTAHCDLAGKAGSAQERVSGYDSFETGPFSEKEKAGLRYAGLLHVSGHAVDDVAFAELSRHFVAEEIVELTAVAAAFEFFPRLTSALRIPVTPQPMNDYCPSDNEVEEVVGGGFRPRQNGA